MKYYQPRVIEEEHVMLNFVDDDENFSGAEALRRSSADFLHFAAHRNRPERKYGVKGGPWITPLMLREHTDLNVPEGEIHTGRLTDIQTDGSNLLISQRA